MVAFSGLAAVFGITDTDRSAVTLGDAFSGLIRLFLLNYPVPGEGNVHIPVLPGPNEHRGRILEALNVYLPKHLKM